jgi:hypothetical protein
MYSWLCGFCPIPAALDYVDMDGPLLLKEDIGHRFEIQ